MVIYWQQWPLSNVQSVMLTSLLCRYHLPILLLRYKGVAFAEKYMHRRECSENYTLTSTQCSWVYTQALMDFKVSDYERKLTQSFCLFVCFPRVVCLCPCQV